MKCIPPGGPSGLLQKAPVLDRIDLGGVDQILSRELPRAEQGLLTLGGGPQHSDAVVAGQVRPAALIQEGDQPRVSLDVVSRIGVRRQLIELRRERVVRSSALGSDTQPEALSDRNAPSTSSLLLVW